MLHHFWILPPHPKNYIKVAQNVKFWPNLSFFSRQRGLRATPKLWFKPSPSATASTGVSHRRPADILHPLHPRPARLARLTRLSVKSQAQVLFLLVKVHLRVRFRSHVAILGSADTC
jgi:hypothetical protein